MKVVFKVGRTLCSMQTNTLPMEKQSKVEYQIPCSCGKVYIGEMVRRLETRIKEHRDACGKADAGEVESGRAHLGRASPHQMGGDKTVVVTGRPGQKAERAVAEEGHPHPDDTYERAF